MNSVSPNQALMTSFSPFENRVGRHSPRIPSLSGFTRLLPSERHNSRGVSFYCDETSND